MPAGAASGADFPAPHLADPGRRRCGISPGPRSSATARIVGGRPRRGPAAGDPLRRHRHGPGHPRLRQRRRQALRHHAPGARARGGDRRPRRGTGRRAGPRHRLRRPLPRPPGPGGPPPTTRPGRCSSTAAARDARRQRVIDTAKAFAAGTAPIQDLNPDGDRAPRATFTSGDLTPADATTPDRTAEDAGNSAHEVRTWLAAHGAAGPYEATHSFYRPIKEYTAGFGMMTARSVAG